MRVGDSLGNTSDASITVNAALAISPTAKTLAVNDSFTFTATGGVGAYSQLVVAGTYDLYYAFITGNGTAGVGDGSFAPASHVPSPGIVTMVRWTTGCLLSCVEAPRRRSAAPPGEPHAGRACRSAV